jgi:hypothetical protein
MTRIGIAEPPADIREPIEHVAVELAYEAFAVERPNNVDRDCNVLVDEPSARTRSRPRGAYGR